MVRRGQRSGDHRQCVRIYGKVKKKEENKSRTWKDSKKNKVLLSLGGSQRTLSKVRTVMHPRAYGLGLSDWFRNYLLE